MCPSEESKTLPQLIEEMKHDWDWRAKENAKWFINTYKVDQTEAEFDETGKGDFQRFILSDLDLLTGGHEPGRLKVLEIGCGIGRMTRHLAGMFGEVHGTDVSAEMVRLAKDRLKHYSNIHFHETNGADFSEFQSEQFDLIICTLVFQHLPDTHLVSSNINEAFRLLKPGGIFKFATNGITDSDFASMPKDTWTGVAFGEEELRGLAKTIGASLLQLVGGGTQYCCAVIRKQTPGGTGTHNSHPAITGASHLSQDFRGVTRISSGHDLLTILLGISNPQEVDANNLVVELGGKRLAPCYVGPVRSSLREKTTDDASSVQVEVAPPADVGGTTLDVRVILPDGLATGIVTVEIPRAQARFPQILQVTNVPDGGLDIFTLGPKSLIRLFVSDLWDGEETEEELRVLLEEVELIPQKVVYLANNAAWEVTVQLPPAVTPGRSRMTVRRGEVSSEPAVIDLR